MMAHLPVLQVIVPLLAAPFCGLFNNRRMAWAIAASASIISVGIAVALAVQVSDGSTIRYEIGGWAAPYGIEYVVDPLTAIILLVVTSIAALVFTFGAASEKLEIPQDRAPLYYILMLLNLAGLSGMTITGDVFNLFVFLEISSLSTYALVSLGRNRQALTSAFQYLVIGTVGATFYVIGVGLLYAMTGSLNIADLALLVPSVADTTTVRAALAFLVIGIGVKLGMMPLHFWLPNAYTFAPSMVSTFLAATATKVAVYALLRIIFTLFGVEIFTASLLAAAVLVLGVVAMLVASAAAIFQKDAKRLLAFSSLAQIGYILLGAGLATPAGLTASVLHVFNHALMKGALFFALAAVAYRIGSTQIEHMKGLGKVMPLTIFALVLGGFSLIGLPLTVGFLSKWYLLSAIFTDGAWPLAALVLVSSLLAVVYVWRLVEAAYFYPRPEGSAPVEEAPLAFLIPIWLLIGANFYFGVQGKISVGLAEASARLLTGGAQ